MKVDNQLFEITTAKCPSRPTAIGSGERRDGAARGLVARHAVRDRGDVRAIFDRIESEMSGYYLLGVESDPSDRDGKAHAMRVEVQGTNRPCARGGSCSWALRRSAPRGRVAARSRRGSARRCSCRRCRCASRRSRSKARSALVQLLIHAIGNEYTTAKSSIGYMIFDRAGRVVEASRPRCGSRPGRQRAVAARQSGRREPRARRLHDEAGDRRRRQERQRRAPDPRGACQAGGGAVSELMVGGPLDSTNLLRPIVGYLINYGSVQAYVEASSRSGSSS